MKLGSNEIMEISDLIDKADREDLEVLTAAINDRHRYLKRQQTRRALAELQVGDEVRLTNIKPKYLSGTRATITERKGTKFAIRFHDNVDPRAIRRFGRTAITPATTLEKVT